MIILLAGCHPEPYDDGSNTPADTEEQAQDTTDDGTATPVDIVAHDLPPAPDVSYAVWFNVEDFASNAGENFTVSVIPITRDVNQRALDDIAAELAVVNLITGESVPFEFETQLPPDSIDWPEPSDHEKDGDGVVIPPDDITHGFIHLTLTQPMDDAWHAIVIRSVPDERFHIDSMPRTRAPMVLQYGVSGVRIHPNSAPEFSGFSARPTLNMDEEIVGIRVSYRVSTDIVWTTSLVERLTPTNLTTGTQCTPPEGWRTGEAEIDYINYSCAKEDNTINSISVPDISSIDAFSRTFVTEPLPTQVDLDLAAEKGERGSVGLKF